MASKRKIVLGAGISGGGYHTATWRHPRDLDNASINMDYFVNAVKKAEMGKMDFVFLGDSLFINEKSNTQYFNRFEPLTLLSALAMITSQIGLIGTLTTTYSEPFNAARQFASLDHISNGRAGWNVVTSAQAGTALNYGKNEHLEHGQRYKIAEEFVEVTKGLWDSWEDDAFIRDKEKGIYFDKTKLHTLNYKGEFFSVQGPLNIGRSKQGYPVIAQAGSSEAGKTLAAKVADVIFTVQHNIEDAKTFYQDVKNRVISFGRSPDEVFILSGLHIIVGQTEEEANSKYQEIADLVNMEDALKDLSHYFNDIDFSQYPLDEPFPDLGEYASDGHKSFSDRLKKIAKEENLTLRQLAQRVSTPKGGNTFIGTPLQIADTIQEWFEAEAVDGFIINPGPIMPEGLNDFIDYIIPILQERGIFRTEYEADTLRGNLGLQIPVNRYSEKIHQ